MLKRIITGAIIFLVTALFVGLRYFSPYVFDAYALIISYGCLFEMIKANKIAEKNVSIVPLCMVPLAFFAIFSFATDYKLMLASILALAILIFLYSILEDIIILAKNRKNKTEEPSEAEKAEQNKKLFDRAKTTMQIFAYPLIPLACLFAINHLGFNLGFMGIILAFAVSMLTDTFAYFFGMAFGKRKFVPEVSPKKTIAGMVGGFVGGIVGATVAFCVFYFANIFQLIDFSLSLSVSTFAIIGVLGSLINQLGDLVESAFKRKVGIKDSSNIFPGHGGFLDRVDGLMFTSSLIYITFLIFLV